MEKLKIAMMSMTHGHTRKYYQVLKENPKLEWIAEFEGERVNDFIKSAIAERLERYSVPDLRVAEGQLSLDLGVE